jgi:hypothetical protein
LGREADCLRIGLSSKLGAGGNAARGLRKLPIEANFSLRHKRKRYIDVNAFFRQNHCAEATRFRGLARGATAFAVNDLTERMCTGLDWGDRIGGRSCE